MSNLLMFSEHSLENDDTPFPLLVAKHFNFPLAYHERGDEIYYAIQDWMRGLLEKQEISANLAHMKKNRIWNQVSKRVQYMTYQATDKKTYQRDFTIEENLILILQYLRAKKASPRVSEVRGLFSHWLAENTSSAKTNNVILNRDYASFTADELADATIRACYDQGWNTKQVTRYLRLKLKSQHFLEDFRDRMVNPILPEYYDTLTEDVYKGLWGRTPVQLKLQLGVATVSSIALEMPQMVYSFHGIVEEMVLDLLKDHEQVSWAELRATVKYVAAFFRPQIKQISTLLKKDIVTGHPL